MRYHVVLQGPRSKDMGAAQALAEAIASRYGVPVEAITERLAVGGFRVKTDVDLDTAMSYAVDLTKLGGACLVVDAATGEPVEEAKQQEPVGLAAASGDIPIALGALEGGQIVVSTLDGEVDQPPKTQTAAAFGPTAPREDLEFLDDGDAEALAVDSTPYEPTELARPSPAAAHFAPPPSEVGDDELLLAEDPRAVHTARDEARAPIVLPPPSMSAMAPPATRPRGPSLGERLASARARARLSLARRGPLHFLTGAVLAVLVGFVLAHVVASLQETNAYPPLAAELKVAYAEAVDPNTYATLPDVRDGLQLIVDARQRRIAITGGIIWLVAAAGFAFLWFRKIRWEALEPPRPAREPDSEPPEAPAE